MFTESIDIWSCEKKYDDGQWWWVINQDTYYPVSNFAEAEARADYVSPNGVMERYNSDYSAWCD